jgi:hypothetical protein
MEEREDLSNLRQEALCRCRRRFPMTRVKSREREGHIITAYPGLCFKPPEARLLVSLGLCAPECDCRLLTFGDSNPARGGSSVC